MKLTVLGSSSSGNGYVIQDEREALIIECGVSLQKAKQVLNFNTTKVSGCLISHLHGDHSKYAKDYEKCFNVFANSSTIKERGLQKTTEIFSEKTFYVGNFKVIPFTSSHDVPCFGFVVGHERLGNLLFVTDSCVCDYIFPHINHILIESNYINHLIDDNVKEGITHPKVRDRVALSHMELDMTKRVLLNQPLDNVYNIILIHLSEHNSDPKECYNVISKAIGKPTIVAKTGVEVDLINEIF